MRPRDQHLADALTARLGTFHRSQSALPGIRRRGRRESFVEQLVESVRRVRYLEILSTKALTNRAQDPGDELFDPLKAAVIHGREGNVDEALWLVFLVTHFGSYRGTRGRYLREIYGRLGDGRRWDWRAASRDPRAFRRWLGQHQQQLKRGGSRGFGSHRKYESLDAHSATGTGAAVQSYVEWIGPPRTHAELFAEAIRNSGTDPFRAFDVLYHSMETVLRFGRTARFDYLSTIGHLGLATIEAGSAYLDGATGPLRGARLLFEGRGRSIRRAELDRLVISLGGHLQVGMRVMEDALCNWQKSPDAFQAFRG